MFPTPHSQKPSSWLVKGWAGLPEPRTANAGCTYSPSFSLILKASISFKLVQSIFTELHTSRPSIGIDTDQSLKIIQKMEMLWQVVSSTKFFAVFSYITSRPTPVYVSLVTWLNYTYYSFFNGETPSFQHWNKHYQSKLLKDDCRKSL